jgi:hypothetical protein
MRYDAQIISSAVDRPRLSGQGLWPCARASSGSPADGPFLAREQRATRELDRALGGGECLNSASAWRPLCRATSRCLVLAALPAMLPRAPAGPASPSAADGQATHGETRGRERLEALNEKAEREAKCERARERERKYREMHREELARKNALNPADASRGLLHAPFSIREVAAQGELRRCNGRDIEDAAAIGATLIAIAPRFLCSVWASGRRHRRRRLAELSAPDDRFPLYFSIS